MYFREIIAKLGRNINLKRIQILTGINGSNFLLAHELHIPADLLLKLLADIRGRDGPLDDVLTSGLWRKQEVVLQNIQMRTVIRYSYERNSN